MKSYHNSTREWWIALLLALPMSFSVVISYFSSDPTSVGGLNFATIILFFMVSTIVFFMNPKIDRGWMTFFVVLILLDIIIYTITPESDAKFFYYDINRYGGLLLLLPVLSQKLNYHVFIHTIIIFYILHNLLNFLNVGDVGFSRSGNVSGSSFNSVASIDLLGLPVIIYSLINCQLTFSERIWLIICHVMICLMILLSGSRSAYPIMTVLLVFEFLTFRKKIGFFRTYLILFLIVGVVIFFVLQNDILTSSMTRVTAGDLTQDEARELLWAGAISKLDSTGWVWGAGLPLVYEDSEAHNFVLEILLQSGIIGLLLFFCYHYKVLKHARRVYRVRKRLHNKVFIYLTSFSFMGMALFHPIITTSFIYNYLYVFCLMAMFIQNSENVNSKETALNVYNLA